MYLNGLSSSLPERVQHEFIRTLPGLERAEIMRPAYAVEYDYLDPLDLKQSLESKILENLFIAGQTNGTSGYEEAAAQGIMAGINAALRLQGKEPFVLRRSDAYIGVLIDDLTTKGTKEPYRMFTSRAEYRLVLRNDNADSRLTPLSPLASKERREALERKCEHMEEIKELLKARKERGKNGLELLREPEVTISSLCIAGMEAFSSEEKEEVELDLKYDGYLKRQEREIARFEKNESVEIPQDFDYDKVDGLSQESREKFKSVRPRSVGQAGRISGVRVSDIAVLQVALRGVRNVR